MPVITSKLVYDLERKLLSAIYTKFISYDQLKRIQVILDEPMPKTAKLKTINAKTEQRFMQFRGD